MIRELELLIEKAADSYVKLQGSHDKPDITKHDFIAGANYAIASEPILKAAGLEKKEEGGMIENHLKKIKQLGLYADIKLLLDEQRDLILESIMETEFYRKHKFNFPKSSVTLCKYPERLEEWKRFQTPPTSPEQLKDKECQPKDS